MQRYYGYYRRAIRDALTRRSRKPFQCGGLRGYDQLLAIHQHLSARCAHGAADPYLAELQQRVQTAVEAAAPQAKSVRQAWTFLTQMEHYLAQTPRPAWKPGPDEPTPSSEAVRQELEERVADWETQAVAGSTTQRLRRKWQTLSRTWLPGILHCYDTPGLPRHNLQLEGIFGTLRRHQRRVSGRKETSLLRVFGPGEIMFLALQDDEVLAWLRAVPTEEYWTQRRRQEEREEPRRWLTRLRRNPERALTQVDEQFYEVVKARFRASPGALLIRDD